MHVRDMFEMELECSTYLHIFGEVIVHVQVYGSEIPRIVEFEGYFNGTAEHAWRVVSPAYPFVSLNKKSKKNSLLRYRTILRILY